MPNESNASAFGTFVWHELLTTDSDAALAFYQNVIGWKAQDSGHTDRGYKILMADDIKAKETKVGGLMTLPPEAIAKGARPCWMGYIAVDDVNAYAARIVQAGGMLHREAEDIPGVGRFAVVADPQGAPFVLFTAEPGQTRTETPPDTPQTISWNELYASTLDPAFEFYASLFGWTKAQTIPLGPFGFYHVFAQNGAPHGGMITKTPIMPIPFWLYYITVADIKEAMARVVKGGGSVVNGPHMIPSGKWIAHCFDPQGALFGLMSKGL